MQRHRNEEIGFREQLAAGAVKPTREGGRAVEPVAVFEAEDQFLRCLVINKERARLVEGTGIGVAYNAKRFPARIDAERNTAAMAHRPFDERNFGPAGGTKSMGFADARAARNAKGWKEEIERITEPLARKAGTKDFRSGGHAAILVEMSTPAPEIFDRLLYRERRIRAAAKPADDPFLARDAASQMALRLQAVNRRFEKALYLNSREQGFDSLQPLAKIWVRAGYGEGSFVIAGEEALPFAPESFDLIVSVLSLHAVNDLPGALVQIRRALKPDGLFVASLFGGDTLQELRIAFAAAEVEIFGGASPRVAPFAGVKDLGGLLQRAGFALPVADVERTMVRYRELPRLFADLRALGETNALCARRKNFLPRRILARLAAEYRERFPDLDGRYPATFEIVNLTGWAPHESQQVPLKPGSAKMRLADVLVSKQKEIG